MSNLVLTVVGGGNAGHTLVGFSPKDVETRLLTRRPKSWRKRISVFYKSDTTPFSEGELSIVSASPEEVIPGSDLILICGPVSSYDQLLTKIAAYVESNSHVGLLFAQGCTHFNAQSLMPDAHFFGFQTIPWICRTLEYGKASRILEPQKSLRIATNSSDKETLAT